MLAIYLLSLPTLPYIEYFSFQEYIAQNFCVNKDVPDSCCQGKCYLDNQLDENSNAKEENQKNTVRSLNEIISDLPPLNLVFWSKKDTLAHQSVFINHYNLSFLSGIMHPPES